MIRRSTVRRQNFGRMHDAFTRIVKLEENVEIACFDLSANDSSETAAIFGEVCRRDDEWKFKAAGQGFGGWLESMRNHFGVSVT